MESGRGPPPPDLTCPVCADLLKNAVEMPCCRCGATFAGLGDFFFKLTYVCSAGLEFVGVALSRSWSSRKNDAGCSPLLRVTRLPSKLTRLVFQRYLRMSLVTPCPCLNSWLPLNPADSWLKIGKLEALYTSSHPWRSLQPCRRSRRR